MPVQRVRVLWGLISGQCPRKKIWRGGSNTNSSVHHVFVTNKVSSNLDSDSSVFIIFFQGILWIKPVCWEECCICGIFPEHLPSWSKCLFSKACWQATVLPHTKPVCCSRHRHVWMRHRRNCAIRLICGARFRRMISFFFFFYHLRERLNPPRICLSSTIKWKQEGWWISTLSHIDHLSVSWARLGGCRRNYITVAGQWISGFSAWHQAECKSALGCNYRRH